MASYADKVRDGANNNRSTDERDRDSARPQEHRTVGGQDAPDTSNRAANATRNVEEVFESQEKTPELLHPTKA
jgi:hypothetical protein